MDNTETKTVRFTMDVEEDFYNDFKEACELSPMTRVTRMLWENFVKAHNERKAQNGTQNNHVAAGHS